MQREMYRFTFGAPVRSAVPRIIDRHFRTSMTNFRSVIFFDRNKTVRLGPHNLLCFFHDACMVDCCGCLVTTLHLRDHDDEIIVFFVNPNTFEDPFHDASG